MATGHVARFDPRRGYGFLIPDDGGEDVFVHQNNINMDGFRYLKPGEQVRYELEVSEKGLKAVDVALLSERQDDDRGRYEERQDDYDDRRGSGDDYGRRERYNAPRRRSGGYERNDRNDRRGGGGRPDDRLLDQVDKLRRKQERLISLLVSKGVLSPGEVDGLDGATMPEPAEADEVAADIDGDDDLM